jgi:hypothetical protein
MRMISAGANIDACGALRESISEIACKVGFKGLWLLVLAESGYDP